MQDEQGRLRRMPYFPNKVLLLLSAPHLIRPSFPRFTSVHNCWAGDLDPRALPADSHPHTGSQLPIRHSAPTTLASWDNL